MKPTPHLKILSTYRNVAAKNRTQNSKCNYSCRWTCCSDPTNFTEPCTNLAWCSTQADHTLNWSTSTAPARILPSKPKLKSTILAQHGTEGNSPNLSNNQRAEKENFLHKNTVTVKIITQKNSIASHVHSIAMQKVALLCKHCRAQVYLL